MNVRAVTFDCWGTLITDLPSSKAIERRNRAVLDASDGALDEAGAEDLGRRAWAIHHEAWLRGEQYGSAGMARWCGEQLGLDGVRVAELQRVFEEANEPENVRGLPGAADTLAKLRTGGIRTALVCDAGFTPGRVVRGLLDGAGALEHLEYCAFSDEVGVPKPAPEIFKVALDAIDTDPRHAVHVGDLLRTDVHGARGMGMRSIRITEINDDRVDTFSWDRDADPDPGYGEADEVIASYDEFPDALRRLGAEI